MNPGTAVVATTAVVVTGRWVQEKKLDLRLLVAAGFLAIMMAMLNEAKPKLAGQFATLILATAVLVYGVPIARRVSGITSGTFKQANKK